MSIDHGLIAAGGEDGHREAVRAVRLKFPDATPERLAVIGEYFVARAEAHADRRVAQTLFGIAAACRALSKRQERPPGQA